MGVWEIFISLSSIAMGYSVYLIHRKSMNGESSKKTDSPRETVRYREILQGIHLYDWVPDVVKMLRGVNDQKSVLIISEDSNLPKSFLTVLVEMLEHMELIPVLLKGSLPDTRSVLDGDIDSSLRQADQSVLYEICEKIGVGRGLVVIDRYSVHQNVCMDRIHLLLVRSDRYRHTMMDDSGLVVLARATYIFENPADGRSILSKYDILRKLLQELEKNHKRESSD